jgi:hypothetical protein
MQVGVDLSGSPRPILGEEVEARCAAAQQLLGQLGPDLDSDSSNLIIVIGNLVDPVGY